MLRCGSCASWGQSSGDGSGSAASAAFGFVAREGIGLGMLVEAGAGPPPVIGAVRSGVGAIGDMLVAWIGGVRPVLQANRSAARKMTLILRMQNALIDFSPT